MSKQENGKGGNFDTKRNPFMTSKPRLSVWPDVAAQSFFGQACNAALTAGCAVMLGTTRDGGALVITILDGDDRHRTYCSNDDELDEAITSLLEMYTGSA